MNFHFLRLAFFTLATAAAAFADVTLAPLFRDGAVLQRDQPLPIWGRAEPGAQITVSFAGQEKTTTAGPNGKWRVELSALAASAEPRELLLTSENRSERSEKPAKSKFVSSEATGLTNLKLQGVLVGDVWLCSGQSNMAWFFGKLPTFALDVAAADFPLIRQFKVPNVVAEQPADDVGGSWVACSPATVANFSMVAFYFARDLHQRLGVPIGLVNSSWGGTQIESWLSAATLRADPADDAISARWEQRLAEYPAKRRDYDAALAKWTAEQSAAQAAGRAFTLPAPMQPAGPGSQWQPASLYNAMIAPLVPYGLRGVIWYQGETNAPRHAEYASLFTALIRQWRADFAQPGLPFYFVQLANFESPNPNDAWAYLREAQAQALALPATGMAVTIDIGNPADIHPVNKWDVGRRLARHARVQLFDEQIETDGPVFQSAAREGGALRVRFTHAAGMRLEPPKGDGLVAFEVAGEDLTFVAAEARVDGETLLISADAVPVPVAVRYAWRNSPDARLFNGDGLPAAPFRSDGSSRGNEAGDR